MRLTARTTTVFAATITLGLVQLASVGYLVLYKFNASATVGYAWTAAAIGFTVLAVVGRRLPAWVCGIATGLAFYSVVQAVGFWVMTPTPPATWEYYFGAFQGVVLLVLAVYLKRWMDAGTRAARLDAEAEDDMADVPT